MERVFIESASHQVGEVVKIAGWVATRRDHGQIIFIDLQDKSGLMQLVFTPQDKELHLRADKLRPGGVVEITGEVVKRPPAMVNPNIATGAVEVKVTELKVLNESQPAPFSLDTDGLEISEDIRMRYRYLDLRRPRLQKNLKARHQTIQFFRDWLTQKRFVEIETPLLTKSTPEGARDYVVPSRLQKGKFYALPQSPQQYKQLLMVAGLERYFQIARCFRDEDTRGDRQPEFTQLDLEMSFVSQGEILNLVEELFSQMLKKLFPHKHITVRPFRQVSYQAAMAKYGTDKPDLRQNKDDADELAFCFVVDFPMFEKKDDGSLGAVHHPFTRPQAANAAEIKEDPLKILAHQYDFVLNGREVGGGSIRTHQPEILQAVFEVLGYSREVIQNQFGHLLEAFGYGVPPHGGIALGIDRLIMILQNEPNIREVIAFPKTGDGRDLMMGSPSELEPVQLKELGLEASDPKP